MNVENNVDKIHRVVAIVTIVFFVPMMALYMIFDVPFNGWNLVWAVCFGYNLRYLVEKKGGKGEKI